jgi:hypothetical protein
MLDEFLGEKELCISVEEKDLDNEGRRKEVLR